MIDRLSTFLHRLWKANLQWWGHHWSSSWRLRIV